MLKQKILQIKAYVKLRRQFKELDAQHLVAFKKYLMDDGKISILKTKWMPNVKPRPEFWGLADYPCIIHHQGDEVVQALALLSGNPDMITFYCPTYSSDTPCTNEKCMHWAENQKHFIAEKEWREFSEKYEAVKKEYDTVRGQIFRHDNGR